MRFVGRVFAGVPGIVLFACLFLPAVRTCGTQVVYPFEFPTLCSPYVLGLLVALALLPVALRTFTILIRVVLYPSAAALGVVAIAALGNPPYGIFFLGATVAAFLLTGFKPCD